MGEGKGNGDGEEDGDGEAAASSLAFIQPLGILLIPMVLPVMVRKPLLVRGEPSARLVRGPASLDGSR